MGAESERAATPRAPLVLLGRLLEEQAGEVATAAIRRASRLLGEYDPEMQERLRSDIHWRCALATVTVGRVMATGSPPSPQEWARIASTGKAPAEEGVRLGDMMKLYLYWRDAAIAMIRSLAAEHAVDGDAVAAAEAAVRAGCDASLVRSGKTFDQRRAELQAELVEEKARLAYLARHDALTGLPNRAALFDALAERIARCARNRSTAAVFFVDLDDFKRVNDEAGHAAGDDVLVSVARRLSSLVRPDDLVARLGGDEFVAVCDGISQVEDAAAVAERFREILERPFRIDGRAWPATASVGFTLLSGHDDAERVLSEADKAMYAEKRSTKARQAS